MANNRTSWKAITVIDEKDHKQWPTTECTGYTIPTLAPLTPPSITFMPFVTTGSKRASSSVQPLVACPGECCFNSPQFQRGDVQKKKKMSTWRPRSPWSGEAQARGPVPAPLKSLSGKKTTRYESLCPTLCGLICSSRTDSVVCAVRGPVLSVA